MREFSYFINGTFSKRYVDVELSKKIAVEIDSKKDTCWYNAIYAQQNILPKSIYVEGYSIWSNNGYVGLWGHGWLEQDGIIIDPSTDIDTATYIYFPAVKYPLSRVRSLLGRNELIPFAGAITSPKHIQYMKTKQICEQVMNELEETWN